MIKNCVVMMFMIMLVATQVEYITSSQEFLPNPKRLFMTCEVKCKANCDFGHPKNRYECVYDCLKHCPPVNTSNGISIFTFSSSFIAFFFYKLSRFT